MTRAATTWALALLASAATTAGTNGQAVSATRGYALMFQGSNPVAAVKKGFVDFADPGMDQLHGEATLACWMTRVDLNPGDLRVPVSWTNKVDTNFFQPFVDTASFFFGELKGTFANDIDKHAWHYWVATVSKLDNTFKLYIDGQLLSEYIIADSEATMRGPDGTTAPGTSFYVGANTYQRIDQPAVALPSKAHFGKLDDLTLFSRALSQAEIQTLMNNPIQRDSVPADAVLHYDFDVTCPGTPGTSPGLLDPACTLAGDKLVPNLGAAGSDYDLLLGEMNNDYGFGKTWSNPTDTEGCPAEHPFAVPDLVPSDSPAGSTAQGLDVPTVAFVGESGQVDLSLPEGHSGKTFTVASVPSSGTLADGAGTPLTIGDTVAGSETVRYSAPAVMDEPVWFHFTVTGGGTHQAHIWPLVAPSIDPIRAPGNTEEANALEDDYVLVRTKLAAVAPGGEELQVVVVEMPSKGTLQDMSEVLVDGGSGVAEILLEDVELAVGSVLTHPSGAVRYTPQEDLYGHHLDSFKVAFRSTASGLSSPPLEFKISVEGIDDKPIAEDSNATIIEDAADGVVIPVKGSDSESRHGMVISRLPRHGTLYTGREDGVFNTTVEREYQIFDVGEVFGQYADKVLSVSSFWGGPPYVGYHAMNVLGRPTCWAKGNGECTDDRPASSYAVGDLIRVPETFASGAVNNYRHAHIERIYEEDGQRKYDARVLPMQRAVDKSLPYEEWTLVPCVLVGPSYPTDCSPEEATKHDPEGPLLRGITDADIRSRSPGVWSPLRKGPTQLESGMEAALAYGSEYAFRNHSGATLYATNDPPYAEYVEVKYKTPVFAVGVEVGSPRGAGAVVAIRLKDNATGEWVPVYEAGVLVEAQTEFNQRGLYHQFAPDVCRPFFSTDTVRLELDTSSETGIGDWNYIDYIQLLGSAVVQPALLTSDAVKYVPDADFTGTDSFEIVSYDCGGDRLRASTPGEVRVSVTPSDDKPTTIVLSGGEPLDPETNLATFDMATKKLELSVAAREVDGDAVEMRVRKKDAASRAVLEVNGVPADTEFTPVSSFNVAYTRAPCERPVKTSDTLVVEVRDVGKPGSLTTQEVTVEIDCGALPRKLYFAEPSSTASSLAFGLGAFGLVLCAGCLGFNFVFRKKQVVKLTSPRVNAVIILGAALVYVYLMTFTSKTSGASGCENFLATLQDDARQGALTVACDFNATTSCCESSAAVPCMAQPWILSIGLTLTFGSLFSKTVRIQKLFMAKLAKVKRISDNQVLGRVGVFLAGLLVYLVAWEIFSPRHMEFDVGQEAVAAGQDGEEVINSPLMARCTSKMQSVFVAGLVAIMGAMLVYGAYLAYSVRNIRVSQANDSKQIAICVYNIMLFGGLNMIIANVIPDPSALLSILSVITFLCVTSTLAILFVPRMLDVHAGKTVNLTSTSLSAGNTTKVQPTTTTGGSSSKNLASSTAK